MVGFMGFKLWTDFDTNSTYGLISTAEEFIWLKKLFILIEFQKSLKYIGFF